MKYLLALALLCFFVQVELLPAPRHLIEPTWENYEGEFKQRADQNLTYEQYIDEWAQVIHDVMARYTQFEIDRLTGNTNPSYRVTSGIPRELPPNSRRDYKLAKKEKLKQGLIDRYKYGYPQFLNEWKEKAHAIARDYTNSEKQRLLKENAGKQVSKS